MLLGSITSRKVIIDNMMREFFAAKKMFKKIKKFVDAPMDLWDSFGTHGNK